MNDEQIASTYTTPASDQEDVTITLTWPQMLALRDLVNELDSRATGGRVELSTAAGHPMEAQPVAVWCCVLGTRPFTVRFNKRGQLE